MVLQLSEQALMLLVYHLLALFQQKLYYNITNESNKYNWLTIFSKIIYGIDFCHYVKATE